MKLNKRNTTRLEKIRQLPCVRCGYKAPSQACHSNFQEHGKGMGTKADDRYTIPLCNKCHKDFDYYASLRRAEAKERFNQWLAITDRWLAEDERVLF